MNKEDVMNLKLGIYEHHRGDFYRVEKIMRLGKKGSEELHALYRGTTGVVKGEALVRPVEVFDGKTFAFVRELSTSDRIAMAISGFKGE